VALFAGERAWESFVLLDFLGLADFLAAMELESAVTFIGFDLPLVMLTNFTESASSLISSTLTLFFLAEFLMS